MTCRSHVLPTIVITGALLLTSACMPISSLASMPLRRVIPKAVIFGVLPVHVGRTLEEFFVLGIGQRIAAFDVVEPQFIQLRGDHQLVLQREVDSFSLSTIAQSCVVELNAGHQWSSGTGGKNRAARHNAATKKPSGRPEGCKRRNRKPQAHRDPLRIMISQTQSHHGNHRRAEHPRTVGGAGVSVNAGGVAGVRIS